LRLTQLLNGRFVVLTPLVRPLILDETNIVAAVDRPVVVDDPVQIVNLTSLPNSAGKEGGHVQVVKREVNVLVNLSSGLIDDLEAL
jgi:hypothetical protein